MEEMSDLDYIQGIKYYFEDRVKRAFAEGDLGGTKGKFINLAFYLSSHPEAQRILRYHNGPGLVASAQVAIDSARRSEKVSEEALEEFEMQIRQTELAVKSGNVFY